VNSTKLELEIDLGLPVFQKANTREEVAEFMSCGVFLVDREIKRGNLNAVKINNGIVRILPSDLLAWLQRAQTAPSAFVAAQQPKRRGRPRKVATQIQEVA
jgi:hypothetical protein